jgi:hypothetical protein
LAKRGFAQRGLDDLKPNFTNPETLAELQTRLQRIRKPDRRLGLEIVAAVSPSVEQRKTAHVLLNEPDAC